MKKAMTRSLSFALAIGLAGCSTTSGVIANPSSSRATYRSVYIVNHGGSGADMDANLQREFLRHGFDVKVGTEEGPHGDAQMLVRYADDWKWDIAMYLRSLDVMLYDSTSGTLLATGRWKNSTFHGFYGSEKVVTQVVDDTLAKANIRQQ